MENSIINQQVRCSAFSKNKNKSRDITKNTEMEDIYDVLFRRLSFMYYSPEKEDANTEESDSNLDFFKETANLTVPELERIEK